MQGWQGMVAAVALESIVKLGAFMAVGIFVTHMHDDHTDMVQAAAKAFACPVYATAEYADVLERVLYNAALSGISMKECCSVALT